MNVPVETISNRLMKALSMKNIKPIELSELTGIPKSSISQYVSGYAKPKADRIYLMSKALGVSEAWLLGYDVDINSKDKANYYLDENVAETADFLLRNKDYKILLDASRKLTEEDLKFVIDMVERMRKK